MSFSKEILAGSSGQSTGVYNGVVETSAMFNDGDSDHLEFTPSSEGNRQICTISAWVKRSSFGNASAFENVVFHAGTASGHRGHLRFYEDHIDWEYYNGSSWIFNFRTSGEFNDTSQWYHLCGNVDTVAGTAKLFVNGVEPALAESTIPSSGQELSFADDVTHQIGQRGYGPDGTYFDGYIADVHFIDGTDLDFQYNGSTVFKLGSNGAVTSADNITAYGSP